MIIKINLTHDSANTYIKSYLEIEDVGDEVKLSIEDPRRVIMINKLELLKTIYILNKDLESLL